MTNRSDRSHSLFRTKVAIKMSKASGKGKDADDSKLSESTPSSTSEEDQESENEGREETPDLYRNSALGIYAGVSVALMIFPRAYT